MSGNLRWDRGNGAIVAYVNLAGASTGSLTISWNDWQSLAQAHAVGTVDGKKIDWWFAAP